MPLSFTPFCLQTALDIMRYPWRRIDGSTPAADRQRIIDEYAGDDVSAHPGMPSQTETRCD